MNLGAKATLVALATSALFVPAPAGASQAHHPIYVVGDSISAGVGTTDPALTSFPHRAARDLHRYVHVDGRPGRCLVAPDCVGTPLVYTFRSEVLHATPKPALVIVEIGVNDLNHATDAEIEWAYSEIIAEGRRAHVKVTLATITPQGDGLLWPADWTASQRARINTWIRALPGRQLELSYPLGGHTLKPEYNSGDGLHPNNLGARVIGRVLARYIKRSSR